MKTRTIFEPSDFEGRGQMIIRESSPPHLPDVGFSASVAYKVGYRGSKAKETLMIALTDGMTLEFDTLEDLCNHLNRDDCGFRPMTSTEIAAVMGHQGNRFP